jgi:hypothetical protein
MDKAQQISERAYYLWVEAGRPGGREQEFWLQAEAEYAREMREATPPKKAKVVKKAVKKTAKAVKKTPKTSKKKKKR